jgi:hypothetical protein
MSIRSFVLSPGGKRPVRAKGQGLVEFALVMPILLTIIFGTFEAARAIWVYTSVAAGSREAARLGSSVSDNGSGTPYYLDCDAIITEAIQMAAAGLVTEDDVTVTYDSGPGTAIKGACGAVPASSIQLGDRVIVEVIGHFQPAAAMPLFSFPTYEIISESRRTIIKEVDLSSSGGGGGGSTTPTNTPTNTPTAGGPTNTPTITPTVTRTPTPGPTNTPSPTVTPAGVAAPVFLNATSTKSGSSCQWLFITIGPNSSWSSNPGYGPTNYSISWTGSLSGSTWIGSNYPNNALWETWQTLNNGNVVNYSVVGIFNWPVESLPRTFSLRCNAGTLVVQ